MPENEATLKQLKSSSRFVIWIASGMLGLFTLVLLMPIAPESSHAKEYTAEVSVPVTHTIQSSVAVSLERSVDIDVFPQLDGSFATTSTKLRVATNNVTGYKVYLTASSDGKLIPDKADNLMTINPVSGSMDQNNYQSKLNSWGYADLTNHEAIPAYIAVPTTANTPLFSNDGKADTEYEIGFAAAIGNNLEPATYKGEVIVSVIANPVVVTNLQELTYMQDMTPEICANTLVNPVLDADGKPVEREANKYQSDNPPTKRLIDTRDGQLYWVAKLADGNCWMTQNLALSAPAGGRTLTPTDSDVVVNWVLPETQDYPFATTNGSAVSWNFGQYVWTDLEHLSSCSTPSGSDPLKNCPDTYTNVSGDNWHASPVEIPSPTLNDGTYDAHYLVGNLYTFLAADAASVSQGRSGSICPKGWKLPLSGTNYDTTNGSFYRLLASHNALDNTTSVQKPLYFTLVGYTGIYSGLIYGSGASGYYWSQVSQNGIDSAWYLSIIITSSDIVINPSSTYDYAMGTSVRCLAR